MRAIWLRAFGAPDNLVVEQTPEPSAGPGQVVVDVQFVNITFVETQFRATGFGPHRDTLPVIPGNGVGGVVAAAGEGVDRALVGSPVVTSTGGSGGYAERVAVPADGLLPVPDGLAMEAAVALLADGRTAGLLVEAAELRAGERVLVEAAAGGVGTLLVQLAKSAGAIVVAAAGGERKLTVAREAGADETVDYRAPDWIASVGEVDVVFDGVGGEIGRSAFRLLRPGGRMISYGLASGEWAGIEQQEAEDRQVRLLRPTAPPEALRALAERAQAAAADGRLRPVIGQRFPLDQASAAHAAIESRRTIGKTLLEVR